MASHALTSHQDVCIRSDPSIDPVDGAEGSSFAQTAADNLLYANSVGSITSVTSNMSSTSNLAADGGEDPESPRDNVERAYIAIPDE